MAKDCCFTRCSSVQGAASREMSGSHVGCWMPLVQCIETPDNVSGLWSQLSYTKVTKVEGWTLVGRYVEYN